MNASWRGQAGRPCLTFWPLWIYSYHCLPTTCCLPLLTVIVWSREACLNSHHSTTAITVITLRIVYQILPWLISTNKSVSADPHIVYLAGAKYCVPLSSSLNRSYHIVYLSLTWVTVMKSLRGTMNFTMWKLMHLKVVSSVPPPWHLNWSYHGWSKVLYTS